MPSCVGVSDKFTSLEIPARWDRAYVRIVLQQIELPTENNPAVLLLGDCVEVLQDLPTGVVAAIVTDPPYGITDCHWDTPPKISSMWKCLNAWCDGTIILTASQPFTSAVVMGNYDKFRVEWIWEKNAGSNFGTVKWQPMKEHESVLVFCNKKPNYTPIMEDRAPSGLSRVKTVVNYDSKPEAYSGIKGKASSIRPDQRYPRSIQKFNRERGLHPNQKPVALIEYFLRTYTKEGDVVLDPYMGSGTTGVACRNLGRRFIGVEMDSTYFGVAKKRIEGIV